MIVFSIAPGIRTLSYAVLAVQHDELRASVLDCDVLHHSARGFSFGEFKDLLARARVHWLVLSVCLERSSPAVLVLGPPADSRENPEYIEACRRVLRTAAITLSVPIIEYQDEVELQDEMGVRARRLFESIKELVHMADKRRSVRLAAAAGMAGASQMLELTMTNVSRENRKRSRPNRK